MSISPRVRITSNYTTAIVECQVLNAQIHHGRDDATTQPDASTAVLELVEELPPEAIIGAYVEVFAIIRDPLAAPHTRQAMRFVGEVTDLRVGWETPELTRPRIIATGYLGRLGRRMVGASPWPEELDGVRANRIINGATVPTDPYRTDAGTVAVLARDVDRQPALGLARDAATDGGGMLWQNRAGDVLYADAVHRRGAAIAHTFDACDVSVELGWVQSLEGLVNDAYVRYGAPEAEVHATDAAAVAAFGTFAASLSTRIANATDAQKRADELVARQASPSWLLGGLEVDLEFLDDAAARTILEDIEVHSLVKVTGMPADSPATDALLWVEGWRETIAPDSWRIAFATSDYCRTAGAARWDDLSQSLTWDTIDPALTWNDVVCIAPAPSGGAWDMVDPSVRWDQVSPSIVWDAWGTGP